MGWAAFVAVKSSHLFPFSDRNLEIWKFRMCFLGYHRIISMCRNLEQKYHTSFRHRCDIKSESIETKKRHKTEKVKLQIASKNNSISNRSFLISHLNQLMQINRLKNTQWIHFTLTMPCGLIGLERIGFHFGFFLGFLHSNIFLGTPLIFCRSKNHYNRLKLSILNCLIIIIEHHHHHHRCAHPVKVAFITFKAHSNGFDWIGFDYRFWIHRNNNKNQQQQRPKRLSHTHSLRWWSDRFNVNFLELNKSGQS